MNETQYGRAVRVYNRVLFYRWRTQWLISKNLSVQSCAVAVRRCRPPKNFIEVSLINFYVTNAGNRSPARAYI